MVDHPVPVWPGQPAGRSVRLSGFVELGSLMLFAGWGMETVNKFLEQAESNPPGWGLRSPTLSLNAGDEILYYFNLRLFPKGLIYETKALDQKR